MLSFESKYKAGFTLLEVIVALTITMLVVVVGASALRTFVSSYGKQKEAAEKVLRSDLAVVLFFRQLQNIPDKVFGKIMSFRGESDYVRFASFVKATAVGLPGIYGVEYRLEDGKLLERDVSLVKGEDYIEFIRDGAGEEKPWFVVMDFEENTNLRFEYGDGKRWQSRWEGGVPKFIGIRAEDRWLLIIPVKFF